MRLHSTTVPAKEKPGNRSWSSNLFTARGGQEEGEALKFIYC